MAEQAVDGPALAEPLFNPVGIQHDQLALSLLIPLLKGLDFLLDQDRLLFCLAYQT